MKNSVEN